MLSFSVTSHDPHAFLQRAASYSITIRILRLRYIPIYILRPRRPVNGGLTRVRFSKPLDVCGPCVI